MKHKEINYNHNICLKREDAEHIYELALQNFQKGCITCNSLKKRLETFICEKATRRIKRIVKKNPYKN